MYNVAVLVLVLSTLVYGFGLMSAQPVLADPLRQEMIGAMLYGDLPVSTAADTNYDRSVTVADLAVPGLVFNGIITQLVPLGLNDQLVYRVTDPTGAVTTETTTVISGDTAGGVVVDDSQISGQQTVSHLMQAYTLKDTRLFFAGVTDVLHDLRTTCSPSLLRLTTPLVAGQTFSTMTQCKVRTISRNVFVGTVDRTDTFTAIEIVESLTVAARTYTHVVYISGSTKLNGDVETDEIYIAPRIGALLQVSTVGTGTTRHELIGGTIDGHPVVQ